MKCPGQDTRYWKAKDIFELPCPICGRSVEFFKDDPFRRCPGCKNVFKNSRLDTGCVERCPYAGLCLAGKPPPS